MNQSQTSGDFMDVYLVGGYVRDTLLNLNPVERDYVVVGATPETMIQQGFQPVGQDFPVFLHPKTKEEYALARTEKKIAPGHKGFTFHTDLSVRLEDDLRRRDLTINAIAQDNQGQLYDPYGGQNDLHNRILRHVSPAFAEDPLRVLRVARFQAKLHHLGFHIAEETLVFMQELSHSGELKTLSKERIWDETYKALQTPHPERYFETLAQCDALTSLFEKEFKPNWACTYQLQQHILRCKPSQRPALYLLSSAVDLCFSDLGDGPFVSYSSWLELLATHFKSLIKQYIDVFHLPKAYQDVLHIAQLSFILSEQLQPWQNLQASDAKRVLTYYQQIDLYRRPERLQIIALWFKLICEQDSLSELAQFFIHAVIQPAHLVAQVQAQPFILQGLQGSAIHQAMQQERFNQLTAQWQKTHE